MSLGLKTAKYGVAAMMVAGIIIVTSLIYVGGSVQPTQTGSTQPAGTHSTSGTSAAQGATSELVVQLTDPPEVPQLTTSLNMTYTSLSLLVGEPSGHPGEINTTTVTMTPANGSATLDLMRLQNVSETLGAVRLPNDSVVYSATFTVSSVKIDVNGTVSSLSLAGGSGTLIVTIANPRGLSGENIALLQLNPVVVQTPTGYELIPSSVGVIRYSQGEGQEQTGSFHDMSDDDEEALENTHGNVTASLTALSVSGNTTTISIEVKNVGNGSVILNAISIHGNFTAMGHCEGDDDSHGSRGCGEHDRSGEVVFVPVNSTVSGTTCTNLTMQLANGDSWDWGHEWGGLTLGKGQCVDLTFTGMISSGESNETLVPSTAAGEVYTVHIVASNGANLDLACTLPVGPTSCEVEHQEHD
jgi:hypothetical protein